MKNRILVIEDDLGIQKSLKLYLESSDFEVETLSSWEKAVETIKKNKFDCIILDMNLPVKDGKTICLEVRDFSQVSIIILTARNSETDKIDLLDIWADDYLSKPFSPRELLARINTVLRRSLVTKQKENENTNKLIYKDIIVDIDKMIVTKNNEKISLTKNEYDILKKILTENWKLVSRECLMKEIIGYDQYVYDRTIDTHIKNLRKKLDEKDIILTVRWEWYRLNK